MSSQLNFLSNWLRQLNTPFSLDLSSEVILSNLRRFIVVKLGLTVVGLVMYFTALHEQWNLFNVLLAATAVDWLFLIPLYFLVKRDPRAAFRLTLVSMALNSISITVGVFLVGDFTHPLFITFSVLIPLALLAFPSPAMAWATAGIATAAYLALAIVQLNRLIPVPETSHLSFINSIPQILFVIVGLWVEALLGVTYVLNREKQRQGNAQSVLAESIWSTVGKALVSTQDLDQVLTQVIQVINDKMHVETGSVLLRDLATDELYFAKILRGNIEQFASVRIKVGQGIAGWVVENGKSALVSDVSHDLRWYASVDQNTGFVTRNILCVPLIAGTQAIGAIELLNKQVREFTQADLTLLESIAAPVAIAIQNAQLHRRIMDQLLDLTNLFHQVEHAKREWESTVDALDVGIALTDAQGTILRVNNTLAQWAKTNSRAMVGQTCWHVIHGTSEPPAFCPHAHLLAGTKQSVEAEFQDTYLGGIFHTTSYPLYDTNGEFVGAVNVLKDITEEKRLQTQLIQSEKLAAAGRLAASLAHEINNPLQGIQGCLDLVEVGRAGAEQEQFLAMARKEVERLTKMVRNMLDFNRASPGIPTPVDMPKIIEAVLALTTLAMQKAGIVVKIKWADPIPRVNGVEDQLKQVFLNIILNAIEAMPNGGILGIDGHVLEEEGWVTVSISDNGTGINTKDVTQVFEPFYTTKVGGTGLGLAVSHSIVTTHGGRLTVESQPGEGSTFIVWLPILSEQSDALSITKTFKRQDKDEDDSN